MRRISRQPAHVPRFYRVPTSLIRIERDRVKRSLSDMRVVYEDFAHYLQLRRRIGWAPEVAFDAGQVLLLSGELAVRAAAAAIPPITPIVCECKGENTVCPEGVVEVPLAELVKEEDELLIVPSPNVLYFSRPLSHDEADTAIRIIRASMEPLLDDVRMVAEDAGGRTVIRWEMPALGTDDSRLRRLFAAVSGQICTQLPVTSINGVSIGLGTGSINGG